MEEFLLHPHPDHPAEGIHSIHVTLAPNASGGLTLQYTVSYRPASIRLPAAGDPLPRERLWAHTCCELFVAAEGETAYREFNFSPCGQWMRFDFSDYRERQVSGEGPAPTVTLVQEDDAFILTATLPSGALPVGPLSLALTVVIENRDGRLGYWALAHPPGKADFHHRAGFQARAELPAHKPAKASRPANSE